MIAAEPDLRARIGKLELTYPTLMGSGCYGSGAEYAPFVDLGKIGGVVLKSVTRFPRLGNPSPRLVPTPGGMLNAIGLQNPGIDSTSEHEVAVSPRPCAVIGSVAGFSVDDYAYVTEAWQLATEIDAIEFNISCPNVAPRARRSPAIRISPGRQRAARSVTARR